MSERAKSPRETENADVPIVYVIDDDELMRRGLTNLFESVGLRVEAFGSAPELLQKKLPDVPSGLIHSDDSQIVRSSSSSRHESRNCCERHTSRPPSA